MNHKYTMYDYLCPPRVPIGIHQNLSQNPLDDPNLPLIHRAVCAHNTVLLAQLLQEQPDCIDLRYQDGDTPLHLAIRCGHTFVAQLLIEKSANLSLKTRHKLRPNHPARALKNLTALSLAAYYGQEEIVRLLLEAGADIFNQSVALEDNINPLIAALMCDTPDELTIWRIMSMLIAACPKWIEHHGLDDIEPRLIHIVALRHHYDSSNKSVPHNNKIFIQLCQNHDVFDDKSTFRGCSPLMMAVRYNTPETIKAFIDAGANPDITDREGANLLHAICDAPFRDTQTQSVIFDMVLPLMSQQHINQQNNKGATPLHHAADSNNSYLISRLLERGADTTLFDIFGLAAFHRVAHIRCSYDNMLVFLNHAPELINLRTSVDTTRPHRRNLGVAAPGIYYGLDSDEHSYNRKGRTLLHLVTVAEHTHSRWSLLASESVARASETRHQMLLELLAQGADPTIEDDEGWTAQELAISENLLSFVDIFKKHAAKQALSSASYAKKRLTL